MENAKFCDLHMHSSCSDGSDSPEELLRAVRKAGIGIFALTDHDTFDGVGAVEKLLAGMADPPRFFRGIEFSCITGAGKVHILGYQFDPESRVMAEAVAEGRRLREIKFERRLAHLEKWHGIRFAAEEMAYLKAQKSVGKPHLARLLVRRGLAPDISGAIRDYLDDHGGKDGTDARIPAAMAIRAILDAGGLPVWAHPLGGEGEKHLTSAEFEGCLRELTAAGIRGLECYYSRYTAEEEAFLEEMADRHGLCRSGGSDYHGKNKDIPPGMLREDNLTIPLQKITILRHLI